MVAVFSSCNYEETLQKYFVANQETPDFISVDIPASFVNLDKAATLTDVQREAYESVNKLNMLAYTLTDDNEEVYKAELVKVQAILKDDRYQDLFRGGNSTDGKIIVKYIGTDTTIDELILFGSANDRGFAVVRVLGNNMEPNKIMQLGSIVNQMTTEESDVSEIMNFFK